MIAIFAIIIILTNDIKIQTIIIDFLPKTVGKQTRRDRDNTKKSRLFFLGFEVKSKIRIFSSENHRHHQSAHDGVHIVHAVGRDFHGERIPEIRNSTSPTTVTIIIIIIVTEKENIDAPLDSADDHVVHRTGHIGDIHQRRLLDPRILLYQFRGAGSRLVVRL